MSKGSFTANTLGSDNLGAQVMSFAYFVHQGVWGRGIGSFTFPGPAPDFSQTQTVKSDTTGFQDCPVPVPS